MRRFFPLVLTATLLSFFLLTVGCGGEAGDDAYTDRLAEEHEGDDPTMPGLVSLEEEPEGIETVGVDYGAPGGESAMGYLARPETGLSEAPPALIVIHEWWGLNENVEAMTRRLAAQGYVALAVDLYGGTVADTPEAAQATMQTAMEDPAALELNLQQAYAYLREEVGAGRVGVIGWCFGGAWALRTALALPTELDAMVIYYGQLETDPDELDYLEMPILGIFGGDDASIPTETVQAFEQTLQELGKTATIRVYEGAQHAFANPSGQNYAPEPAEDAWRLTAAFLAEHLRGTGE